MAEVDGTAMSKIASFTHLALWWGWLEGFGFLNGLFVERGWGSLGVLLHVASLGYFAR